MDKEVEHLKRMQDKWGNKVVQYNIKRSINPVIHVPLKGI
jgi:hypothetical protein